ncbi:MAG TPA: hypothetical protein VGO60_05345 [Iamia sp.]|jgi:hypothetical protein|nr:hypothetical protein [Iamia sp.]
MSITVTSSPPRPTVDRHIAPHPASTADAPTARGRARWPLWSFVGAGTGLVASFLAYPALEEEDYTKGVEVVDKLEAGPYRVSFILGLVSIGCLMVAAAGWRRWAEARAPRDLAARIVGQGIALTTTVMVIFYGIVGAMGLYLHGGVEYGETMSREGLFVNHILLDFGVLLGWWGVAAAAVAMAVMAFRRNRLVPRWMGVVSVLLLLPPVGLAVGTSLPGLVGFFMPIWLAVISLGMVFSRTADAAA